MSVSIEDNGTRLILLNPYFQTIHLKSDYDCEDDQEDEEEVN
jgi:hypothetical protein